jgi:hypothetical protein
MGEEKPSGSSTWKDFNYSYADRRQITITPCFSFITKKKIRNETAMVILFLQKIPLITGTIFQ